MVILEQSYRGTHSFLTESLSLLIIHHNIFCMINLTEIVNLQFLQNFPRVNNKEETINKISSSLFPLPPTVEIQVWEPCLLLSLSFVWPLEGSLFPRRPKGKDSCRCLFHFLCRFLYPLSQLCCCASPCLVCFRAACALLALSSVALAVSLWGSAHLCVVLCSAAVSNRDKNQSLISEVWFKVNKLHVKPLGHGFTFRSNCGWLLQSPWTLTLSLSPVCID